MRAAIITMGLLLAGCGADAPSSPRATVIAPTTFNITRDDFIAAFNRESAANQSGGLTDCGPDSNGEYSCRIVPLHRAEARAEMRRLGVEVPGIEDDTAQLVTLYVQGSNVSRVMIAGDHRVYGAMQMMASLGSAAIVLGGDAARAEFADGNTQLRFMDEVGLLHEPPAFGTQVHASRSYMEVACTLATAELAVYTCHLTPAGVRVDLHAH